MKLLSCVQLFANPWTIAYQAPPPMGFPSKNTGVGCHFLLQDIFLTQGLNPGLPHCWRKRVKGEKSFFGGTKIRGDLYFSSQYCENDTPQQKKVAMQCFYADGTLSQLTGDFFCLSKAQKPWSLKGGPMEPEGRAHGAGICVDSGPGTA